MTFCKYYHDEDLSEIVVEVEVETSQEDMSADHRAQEPHVNNVNKFASSSDESSSGSSDESSSGSSDESSSGSSDESFSGLSDEGFIETIGSTVVTPWKNMMSEREQKHCCQINIIPKRIIPKRELIMTSESEFTDDSNDKADMLPVRLSKAVKLEKTRNIVPKTQKEKLYMTSSSSSSEHSDDESNDEEETNTQGKHVKKEKNSFKRIEVLPKCVFDNVEMASPTSSLSHTADGRWKKMKEEDGGGMIKKEPMLSEYYFTDESSSHDEGAIDTNDTDPTWSAKKRRDQPFKSTKPKQRCKIICKKKQSKVYPKITTPKKVNQKKMQQQEVRTKSYTCNRCSLSFVHPFSFQKHNYTVHSSKPGQKLTCDQCPGSSFPSTNALKIHLYAHKELKCCFCQQRCHFKSQMERHMRIHLNLRPYKCKYCGATFTQSGNLNVHMRMHRGDQPFKCDLCARKFTWKSVYSKHLSLCVPSFVGRRWVTP